MADDFDIPDFLMRNPPEKGVPMPANPERVSNAIEKTPREEMLAELAEKAKQVKPVSYSVTSKNITAKRVIHDHLGNQITIGPGETRQGVLLRPDIAEYLGKGDLAVRVLS